MGGGLAVCRSTIRGPHAAFLTPQFPPAADRPIKADQVQGDVALCDGQLVLDSHLRGLKLEDRRKCNGSSLVLAGTNFSCCDGRSSCLGKRLGLLPRTQESAQRGLSFLSRREHLVLIRNEQFL